MTRPIDLAAGDGLTRLSQELRRLDVYTFWMVPAGTVAPAADVIVVGTTGVFLVAAWAAGGAFSVLRGRPVVDSDPIPGIRALRSDAKRLGAKLSAASVFGSVTPIVALTHAAIGMPREVKKVRFVGLTGLIDEITGRPRALELLRVQRAARVLGVQIPGDGRRYFT